ncbi:MAG: helix-turn-helix domain-containing protein [Armatimonadota bacterium]|nr:helix-turn-helix domain-containing protein [Armatimonadota bacterium]MDR7468785.1 helix-turn-helix domain-containing protein [Armatimonadota bacterium]MDR7538612.1 helix-turn-helix domain-containing protein [Armatimonadota bacterium]
MVVWVEEEAYLTAQEVCALLGVKPQTLYAYVSRGVLRSYRRGRRRQRLYQLREVESLLRLRPARGGWPRAILPRAEEWVGDR